MNFFEHQHRARKRTQLLVLLYGSAVVAIILAVTALITFVFFMNVEQRSTDYGAGYGQTSFWDGFLFSFYDKLIYIGPPVALLIAAVSFFRMTSLSGRGAPVAEYLGGQLLLPSGDNVKELQLKNVVEEMAIASGMPVPAIYVMRGEHGINAFAAGTDPSNAVVGVTEGAMENLTRDELQGVMAHEFSHIFNGDSRLNVSLMGWLAGITFLAVSGRVILEGMGRSRGSSRKNDGAGAIALLGLGLLVIGYIGVFFARWIKAAVSRQREFLADASAVQFTRNPQGIGSALGKIAAMGSQVPGGQIEEASHFFFGSVKDFFLFSTHPPIEERLRRLGQLAPIDSSRPRAETKIANDGLARVGAPSKRDLMFATTVIQGVSAAQRQNLNDPHRAMQLVIGLLASENGDQKILSKVPADIRALAMNVAAEKRLLLVELALPSLKRLDAEKIGQLQQAIAMMIEEDQVLRPFEIAVAALLRRHLEPIRRPRFDSLRRRRADALSILRLVAEAGHPGQEERALVSFLAGVRLVGIEDAAAKDAWPSAIPIAGGLSQALFRLGDLKPVDKEALFAAIWAVAYHDRELNADESVWLRAVSEALEIPLPPTATATITAPVAPHPS